MPNTQTQIHSHAQTQTQTPLIEKEHLSLPETSGTDGPRQNGHERDADGTDGAHPGREDGREYREESEDGP